MPNIGKALVIMGVVMVIIGGVVWGLGRLGFRGLPGDIRYQSGNVQIYFPIVTMLVVSVLLTLALWVLAWFTRR